MTSPTELDPFPSGWYALGASADLRPGEVQTRRFFGRELVLYRTEGGVARVTGAHCPHLGAHLARGGRVVGERLRCPFHGFEFDGEGACVRAYGEPGGAIKGRLETLPLLDRNGWLLVWGDRDGRAPDFEPPRLETDGWSALDLHEWRLRSHPQETTENSVDVGHFTAIHGYSAVRSVSPLRVDGAYLTATYGMERPNLFGRWLPPIRTEFKVHVWGLGYSQVDVSVLNYGFDMRLFVLPQPTDGDDIVLRVAMSTRDVGARSRLLPSGRLSRGITHLVNRQAGAGAAADVADDFEIWNHKVYVAPPSLARGDGPIGRYRAYARQFYRDETAARGVDVAG